MRWKPWSRKSFFSNRDLSQLLLTYPRNCDIYNSHGIIYNLFQYPHVLNSCIYMYIKWQCK
jgi:hypothetical protein